MSFTSNNSLSRIRIIGSGVEGRTDNHFAQPRGICIDPFMKELFVVDCNNHRVCVFSLVSLTFLRQIGRGIQGSGPGCLNYAVGACLDFKNHHIYIADTNNHRISIFDQITGAFIRCIGFHGMGRGELNSPYGVCIDSATGSLFVTDYDNHRVQVFDITTRKFLRTIGSGLGSGPGQMNQPIVPYLDEETGFLYIADYSNNRVQIFNKDTGAYIRQIGGGGVGGNVTGLGADALNGPRGICIDGPSGLLFIADRENHRIKVYDKSTFVFLRFLGNGQGASPGQFHRPMEICVSSDDSSIFVVDGYNHRVQVLLLPELLAARKVVSSLTEKKRKLDSQSTIRPSRIAVRTDISLLRLPRYHGRLENTMTSNSEQHRVKLLFPIIGSYIIIPASNIGHLSSSGFFIDPTCDDSQFSAKSPPSPRPVAEESCDSIVKPREPYDPSRSPNTLQLNHQAAVFMGLINGVVTDSWESIDCSFSAGRTKSSSLSSPQGAEESQSRTALLENTGETKAKPQNDYVIDYSLIVPSVFALYALLERSWLPGAYMPSSVINSLVHLMCHDDASLSAGNRSERGRVVAASAALLAAVVSAGKEAAESVFSHIIAELHRSAAGAPSDPDSSVSVADTSIEDASQSEGYIQISVSPYPTDRSILGEIGIESRAADGFRVEEEEREREREEALDTLRILAFILSSQSDSICPYPSSLPVPSTSLFNESSTTLCQSGEEIYRSGGRRTPSSLSTLPTTAYSYESELRILVFGQAWCQDHGNAMRDRKGSRSELGAKRMLSPGPMTPSTRPPSQPVSPVPLHSFPPFPLGSSPYSHDRESLSYPRSRESSYCPLSKEVLDLLESVSRINRHRQSCEDGYDFSSRDTDRSCSRMQLELLEKANICFRQIPPYRECSRKLCKTSQGGRHIWQIGQPLAVGDLVDARDREKSWFESYITEVRPSAPSASPPRSGGGRERLDVKVHYMGWGSKWDDWVSEWDLGTRIAPLNSRSKNWRADLFEGGLIEIKCNDDMVNQKWMWGKIIALNYSEGWVDVSYTFTNEPTVVKRADLFGETLCMVGMHTKDKSKLAAASIVRPERKVEELLRAKGAGSAKNGNAPLADFTFCDFEDSLSVEDLDMGDNPRRELEHHSTSLNEEVEGGGLEMSASRSAQQSHLTVQLAVGLISKSQLKGLSAVKAADCISSITFNCVMREVLEILTEQLFIDEASHASVARAQECVPAVQQGAESVSLVAAAISVLRTIAASSSRRVLVPFFCRVLTVQCGLRSKLIAQNEVLSRPSLLRLDITVTPLANLLDGLDALGDSYCSLLLKCFDSNHDGDSSGLHSDRTQGLPLDQLQHAARRIKATVSKCAIAPIARSVFRAVCPPSSTSTASSPMNCLTKALTDNLLEGARFSSASSVVRRLLGVLTRSASETDLDLLEVMWTNAISSWVVCAVQKHTASPCASKAPPYGRHFDSDIEQGAELDSSDSEMKSESPAITSGNRFILTAPDLSEAQGLSPCGSYSADTDTEESSTLLLLHRLVSMLGKARSISSLEFNTRQRCTLSADVAFRNAFSELSEHTRHSLLRAMVHSVDSRLVPDCLPDSSSRQDSPSGRPNKMEELLDFIQVVLTETNTKYFEDYYQLLLARRLIKFPYSEGVYGGRDFSPRSDRTMLLALPPMSLAASMITDIEQTAGTMSDFRHHLLVRIDSEELAYPSSSILSLTIKPGALNIHILSTSSWPKGLISALPYASLKLPASLSFVASEFETFFQATSASGAKKNSKFPFSSSSTGHGSKGSRGAVRLHWCHSVGTVTLSCRINQKPARHSPAHGLGGCVPLSPTVTIILSTPQAAIMMAFQSYLLPPGSADFTRPEKIQRSTADLSKITGLWNEELQDVLSSLCDPALPLLVPVDQRGDIFALSEHLLSGSLGGLREEDPLVVNGWTLNPAPKHPSGLGSGLSQSWRESMIDACIIRTLKRVGREKSEVFFDSAGRTLRGTMPFDRLCSAAKLSLEKKTRLVIVPSQEIRMRCNRLVSQGCIEVIKGLSTCSTSPQLVGYSYLPDLPDEKLKDTTAGEMLFTRLCEVVAPSDAGMKCSGARVSIDQFCSGFSSWITKCPLESRSGSLDVDNTQRDPAPALPDMTALSLHSSVCKDSNNVFCKPMGCTEEGGDRSGEHKDGHQTHSVYRPAAAPFDVSGISSASTTASSTGLSREPSKPLMHVQRKVLYALSASLEQLRRLKTQQLEIFGLTRHVRAPLCYGTLLSAESSQLLIRQRLSETQSSSSDWDDFLDINRTVFESLQSDTIQAVLEAFKTLQSISDEPLKSIKTDTADTVLDNLASNLDSLDHGLDSIAYPLLGLSGSLSKDNFSEFFGSVEGKSPDRSMSPFVGRKCDVLMPVAGGAVSSVEGSDGEGMSTAAVADRTEGKSERVSREDLLDSVRTLWSLPVPVNMTQIQCVLRSISSDPDTPYPRNSDMAYSAPHTNTQQRGRQSAVFLREIMRTCSNARPVHGSDVESRSISPQKDSKYKAKTKSSPVDDTSSSTNASLKGRHSPLAEWISSPDSNSVAGTGAREKAPAAADFYSSESSPVQQFVSISFADFVSAALRAGYSSNPKQIGFERWVSFSAVRRSSDQHDGLSRAETDSPTGGLDLCGDSDRLDLRSDVRGLFQTDLQGRRLDPGQGQGHKQAQGRESRGREKTARSGSASMSSSSNRERKVRMRVPRNSPPNALSAGPSSSSPLTLDRILSASSEGIVSPRLTDRSTTHFINGSDGQTSRFLFGSSFQAPRSFADFTGMGVVGVGVGTGAANRGNCSLPRGSVDSTVQHSPAAFAPYNHPSFEDYSANSIAPATFAPLEAESMANIGASCFCPTQQNLPPVPSYPTQSPLPCPAKSFSSIYTLPLPTASFSAEGKVSASCFLPQPFGPAGEHDRARGSFESRGMAETPSNPFQSENESLRGALDCYRKKMDFSLREVFTDFEGLLSAHTRSEYVDQSFTDDCADLGLNDSEENALEQVVTVLLCNAARILETPLSDRMGAPPIPSSDATDSPYLALLGECFKSLDIDRDGFLSLSDFTEEGVTAGGGRIGQGEEEDGREEKSEDLGETMQTLNVSPSWFTGTEISSSTALQSKDGTSMIIDRLVLRACATLGCHAALSDQILRLLVLYKWDADALVLSLTSPSDPTSSALEQSYRCMSAVFDRLRHRMGESEEAGSFLCPCGSLTAPSDVFSLKECGHWHCRTCWLGVIQSSLEASKTSASSPALPQGTDSTLWRCPHTAGGVRCRCLMSGDLVSHLRGAADTAVRREYYLSQLHTCANDSSSSIVSSESTATTPSKVSAVASNASWPSATRYESSSTSCRLSPGGTGVSRSLFLSNIEESRDNERERASSEDEPSPTALMQSSTARALEANSRLLEANRAAERCHRDASLGAECAVAGPNAVRLHGLADRWALLSAATSLLAQTHLALAAEVDSSDSLTLKRGSEGRPHEQTWTDVRSLSFQLEAMESLTVRLRDALSKLSVIWARDPLHNGPQVQLLVTQTRDMTGVLRRLQWDLIEKIPVTHKVSKDPGESHGSISISDELKFGATPLL